MDFSRPHILQESVATKSGIRYLEVPPGSGSEKEETLDDRLTKAANQAARDLLLGPDISTKNITLKATKDLADTDQESTNNKLIDASLYPDRLTPQSDIIEAGQLVVIFESFDNLNFVYATPQAIFSNRNGSFHHNDFLGKPFGCKIRSNTHRGFGYCYRTYYEYNYMDSHIDCDKSVACWIALSRCIC